MPTHHRAVYLEEGINVPNGGDELGYERAQFCLELDSLWRVAADVLEQFLQLSVDR